MRRNRPARQDKGNREIVAAWRQVGATVLRIDPAGDRHQRGAPDYLVGYRGQNFLVELKRPGETLRPEQAAWHRLWRGRKVQTVDNSTDALSAIGFAMSRTKASRAKDLELRRQSVDFDARHGLISSARDYRAGSADWDLHWQETPIPDGF
jgi:hypothetical protein